MTREMLRELGCERSGGHADELRRVGGIMEMQLNVDPLKT